jgi:hypothetical protein
MCYQRRASDLGVCQFSDCFGGPLYTRQHRLVGPACLGAQDGRATKFFAAPPYQARIDNPVPSHHRASLCLPFRIFEPKRLIGAARGLVAFPVRYDEAFERLMLSRPIDAELIEELGQTTGAIRGIDIIHRQNAGLAARVISRGENSREADHSVTVEQTEDAFSVAVDADPPSKPVPSMLASIQWTA